MSKDNNNVTKPATGRGIGGNLAITSKLTQKAISAGTNKLTEGQK